MIWRALLSLPQNSLTCDSDQRLKVFTERRLEAMYEVTQ